MCLYVICTLYVESRNLSSLSYKTQMTGLRHGSVDMTTDVTARIDLCGTEIGAVGIFHRQYDVTINGRTECVSHNCPACIVGTCTCTSTSTVLCKHSRVTLVVWALLFANVYRSSM